MKNPKYRWIPIQLLLPMIMWALASLNETPSYGQSPCTEASEIQKFKRAEDEGAKTSLLQASQSPRFMLGLADKAFQEFRKTQCEHYLFESISLYKVYYERLESAGKEKKPVRESTRNEYKHWLERIQTATQYEGKALPGESLYGQKNVFAELEQFRAKLTTEKLRVDALIAKRNKVLIPSVIAMAIGIPMVVVGSVLVSKDGNLVPGATCDFDGRPRPCVYDYPPQQYGVVVGIGAALTIGGATGLGVSLYQINQQQSPLSH